MTTMIDTFNGDKVIVRDNDDNSAWVGTDKVVLIVSGKLVYLNKRDRHTLAAALLVDPEVRDD